MKLTGKSLESFKKWLKVLRFNNLHFGNICDVIGFDLLPDSTKYGVLVDLFDSVGIRIEVKCKIDNQFNYGIWDSKDWIISSEYFNTRTQARQKAIDKANEIFNNRP